MKSVCIQSFSGPYSVRIRENRDQTTEYGLSSRNVRIQKLETNRFLFKYFFIKSSLLDKCRLAKI